MYWQVYLHKTVLGAEQLLIEIMNRARYLIQNNNLNISSKSLYTLLRNNYTGEELFNQKKLGLFADIDDVDILFAIKEWTKCNDTTLKTLCESLVNRKLPKVIIQKDKFKSKQITELRQQVADQMHIPFEESHHFVYSGKTINRAYNQKSDKIFIVDKNAHLTDIATASDNFNIKSLSKPVSKHFLCYPKELNLSN